MGFDLGFEWASLCCGGLDGQSSRGLWQQWCKLDRALSSVQIWSRKVAIGLHWRRLVIRTLYMMRGTLNLIQYIIRSPKWGWDEGFSFLLRNFCVFDFFGSSTILRMLKISCFLSFTPGCNFHFEITLRFLPLTVIWFSREDCVLERNNQHYFIFAKSGRVKMTLTSAPCNCCHLYDSHVWMQNNTVTLSENGIDFNSVNALSTWPPWMLFDGSSHCFFFVTLCKHSERNSVFAVHAGQLWDKFSTSGNSSVCLCGTIVSNYEKLPGEMIISLHACNEEEHWDSLQVSLRLPGAAGQIRLSDDRCVMDQCLQLLFLFGKTGLLSL